jgi:hypothetical protein
VTVRPDRLSDEYRRWFGDPLRRILQYALGDLGQSDLQRRLRDIVVQGIAGWFSLAAQEGGEIVGRFGHDQSAKEIFIDVQLTPKPNTTVARQLKNLEQVQSRFAGLAARPSASNMLLNWQFS